MRPERSWPPWVWISSLPVVVLWSCSAGGLAEEETHPPYFTALLNVTVLRPDAPASLLDLERGRYGLESPKRAVTGLLLEPLPLEGAANRLGCDARTRFRVPPGAHPWVALLQRGNCTFRQKVLRAASQNVSAVIIYNDVSREDHITMTHQGTGEIVTVMVKQENVKEILDYLGKNMTLLVSLRVGSRFQTQNSRGHIDRSKSLVFVSIPFIILGLVSSAWIVFYFIRKIRHKCARDQNQLLEMSKEEGEVSLYDEYSV